MEKLLFFKIIYDYEFYLAFSSFIKLPWLTFLQIKINKILKKWVLDFLGKFKVREIPIGEERI